MATNVKENYLKALFYLERKDPDISLSDLSREMNVSIPTVNSMVKRLQDENWVVYKKYKPLKLTDKGRKTAALIIRKHRLTEMFLEEFMGFGWEEVHDIAEEVEHVRIEKFFDRMDELLGFPSMDPHGSPIPDKEGNIKPRDFTLLMDVPIGSVVRICALKDSSKEFLYYLNRHQIKLGTVAEVIRIEEFDKSVHIQIKGLTNPMVLSSAACGRLLVEVL